MTTEPAKSSSSLGKDRVRYFATVRDLNRHMGNFRYKRKIVTSQTGEPEVWEYIHPEGDKYAWKFS